jgi:hypothetical protein
VLQSVNTPDIYNENKYQRRNLLLYQCLLDSGLRKFNVSRHPLTPNQIKNCRKRIREGFTYMHEINLPMSRAARLNISLHEQPRSRS